MDSGSEGGSFWHKLSRVFNSKSSDHVEQAIREASQEGELEAEEGSMLLNILHLDELEVQDIMTPRTDVTCVPSEAAICAAVEAVLESGHSRLPIYEENRDNIIGVIFAKDLLRECIREDGMSAPVTTCMHPPFFVPETKNVLELLNEFKTRKTHLAVIVDEYGGTTGIVTIEDVLEEIVGDIEDEHDAPREADIVAQADGSCLMSGRAYLDDINIALGTSLDSDEVETIGGLLSHIAGRLPLPGESFTLGGTVFTVTRADNRQVYQVLARPVDAADAQNHPLGATAD